MARGNHQQQQGEAQGPHEGYTKMNYKARFDLLDTLGKYIGIFSFVGQQTMAAEVPDQLMGGPGCVEKA